MRCLIQGKSFAAWAKYYGTSSTNPASSTSTTAAGGKKKESNTKYFATLEVFPDRKIEDMDDYDGHVTHCTPCNMDPDINYVSDNSHPSLVHYQIPRCVD
jgi:hypothetical protein